MSKLSRILPALIGLVAVAAISFFLLNKAEAEDAAPVAPVALPVPVALNDHVLGKADAPVKIYEYASLTCPHCGHFATKVLPEVKKQLIDTGKAKLVFRDFPLDGIATKAAMIAHCAPEDQYYNLLELFFSNQDRWAVAKDPVQALGQLASLAGVDDAKLKSCLDNKDLEAAILTRMKEAQDKYKVNSTPTFVFNDGADQFVGAQPVEKFVEVVNKLSGGK